MTRASTFASVWALIALSVAACAGAASPSPQAASPVAATPAAASATADASPAASESAEASGSPAASAGAGAGPSGAPGADITVAGVDYAFAGIPDVVPAGTALGFRNDGSEVHEMAVFRINDDVELSLQELLALPEEEAMEAVQNVGHAIAMPGETAEDLVTVEEAGNYGMICFIPVGTTEMPEGPPGESSEEPSGPPHFTVGMLKAFTVGE